MNDLKEEVKENLEIMKEKVEEFAEEVKDAAQNLKEKPTEAKDKKPAPKLGVIRLDYDYPPAKGDIDCPDSFGYDVFYKVVPGLTFEICQSGALSEEVEENFKESIKWLVEEKNRGNTNIARRFSHYGTTVIIIIL